MARFVTLANKTTAIYQRIMDMTRVNPIGELIEMHKYCRPAGGTSERLFSDRFIKPLKGVKQDEKGNWIGQIGENPTVLWSSHTDTVHRNDGFQILAIGQTKDAKPEDDQWLFLSRKETVSNCLGADCTVGVWLMRRMYLAKVPGRYIWHAAEEIGGKGSRYIATETPELLAGIKAAIAFDRKGTTSVITWQSGGRCASQAFVDSIAPMLPAGYTADAGGTFTDTANYTDDVPECTNLSVGYQSAHSDREQTNLGHALRLMDAMLRFDQSRLVIARTPGDDGYARSTPTTYAGGTKAERRRNRQRGGANQYGSYDPLSYGWKHETSMSSPPASTALGPVKGTYTPGARYDSATHAWVPAAGTKPIDDKPKMLGTEFVADASGALTRLRPASAAPVKVISDYVTTLNDDSSVDDLKEFFAQQKRDLDGMAELSVLEARIKSDPRRAAELLIELGYDLDMITKWW